MDLRNIGDISSSPYLPGLAAFLEENPWAFSFADRGAVEGPPVGGPEDADKSGVG